MCITTIFLIFSIFIKSIIFALYFFFIIPIITKSLKMLYLIHHSKRIKTTIWKKPQCPSHCLEWLFAFVVFFCLILLQLLIIQFIYLLLENSLSYSFSSGLSFIPNSVYSYSYLPLHIFCSDIGTVLQSSRQRPSSFFLDRSLCSGLVFWDNS